MNFRLWKYMVLLGLAFTLAMSGVQANSMLASVKSETLYVSLGHDGRIDQMSVVNSFGKGGEETLEIIDYGSYSRIVNLTNNARPAVEGEKIRFRLEPGHMESDRGPFFYEGVLDEVRLPWSFRVAYLLDGEPVSAEELAGRSGDLTLSIHVRQDGEKMEWFQDRFMLQIRVPFSLDKVSRINAPEASQMVAGSSNHLSFIFLPQESQSFVANASVRDFEMEAIEIVALQINPDSIRFKGTGLEDIELLLEGIKEMVSATGSINDGVDASEGAIEQFDVELSSIGIHGRLLAQGLEEFGLNMALLAESVPQFKRGSSQVFEGLGELHEGSQMLQGGYVEIAEGVKKMLEPKDKLREIAGKYLMSPSEDIQTMAFAIAGMLNGLEKLDEGLKEINGHFDSFSGGLQELATEYKTMDEGIAELADQVPLMTREVAPLFDGISGLLGGLPELSRGFSKFYEGYQALPEGLNELYRGQKIFLEELSVAESWMERMTNSAEGRNVVSFVSPEKNQVDSVQFIMRTPEISKPVAQVYRVEQRGTRNFWQRLLDLFSW